ncbi:TonB-dependent receptor domain-containing protein [Campylobacter californiensis]|uniref:TonB-dependent receptor domain-containing protein n=1 Tax=Campylobacter californiensis TaxID=1032243 RepID=UPI00147423AE|nr:TonB-dependent receptor [Campylobacter sp. RM12916]MBE3610173.1 TonB-dependent receptor [Campylobacter sp. RM12916]
MKFRPDLKISLVAALFTSVTFGAQEVALSGVEVTATGGAQEIDAAKVNVRNAALINDVMRDMPGVYIGGTNSLNQKIYIRGINDRGLNITIDGARQKGNAFHHAADLYIDPDIIRSVNVGLGVNSVVGTSGALGGSVAFKTADASDLLEDGEVFGGKIKSGYASNNKEWQESLTLYAKAFESLELLGYVGHRGYGRGESGKGEKLGGNNADNTNYLFKVGYNIADYSKITFSAERMQMKGDFPLRAEWGTTDDSSLVDTKYWRDTYTANFNLNPNDYVDLDLNAYHTKHEAKSSVNAGVKTYGAKAINKTKFETGYIGHTLVYGTEIYQSKSYNKNDTSNTPDDKATSLSVFLEDQLRTGGFTLTPGIRYDNYKLNTMGGTQGIAGRADYSWHEWSPAVNLDYQFDMGLGVYASWARVFRGPDPIEAIRISSTNSINFTTNGDLDPETGDVYEVGTRYQTQLSDSQSLSIIAKYFYNDYDNLIVEMGKAGSIQVDRVNGGRAVVKGGELALRYNISNLSLSASYSRARTEYKDKNSNAGYGGVLAYSDAGDKYTFNAEYAIAPIDTLIGYNLIAFDRITAKNGSGSEFKKPGYAVSDIYATWSPSSGKYKGLEVNFGVYNLFDKTYWSHSQRSAGSMSCPRGRTCPPTPLAPGNIDWEPGRNIKASVSYKF